MKKFTNLQTDKEMHIQISKCANKATNEQKMLTNLTFF